MLSVTSLFANECLKTIPASPALFFSLGTSNWTGNVLKYDPITRRSDKLSAGGMTIALANTEAEFNNLIDSNFFYDVNRRGTIKVGFSDGSSIDTIDLYTGNLIDISLKNAKCELTFLDQWELFGKQKVGNQDSTYYLHASTSYENNPADVFVSLISSWAGLDFGTYVNCAAWLTWRNQCGSDWLYIRGTSTGETIKDLLEEMADKTGTIFATEQGKIYPTLKTVIQSYATYDESNIFKGWELGIETKKIINYIDTLYYWHTTIELADRQMFIVDSESYAQYGKHYKGITRENISLSHYDSDHLPPHRIAYNYLAKYGRPLKKMKITVPMMGFKHQINDRVNVSLAVASLDNIKFRIEGINTKPDEPTKVKLTLLEDKFVKYWSMFNNYFPQYEPVDLDINLEESESWLDMADANTVNAHVANAVIFSGREVKLDPEATKHCYAARYLLATPGDTPQWIKVKMCSVDNTEIYPLIRIGTVPNAVLVFYQDDGYIYARSDTSYVSTGVAYDTTNGETIKCKLNFDTSTWDIYIDDMDTPVLTDLVLHADHGTDLTYIRFEQYQNLANAYFDDLFIGCYDPDTGV